MTKAVTKGYVTANGVKQSTYKHNRTVTKHLINLLTYSLINFKKTLTNVTIPEKTLKKIRMSDVNVNVKS